MVMPRQSGQMAPPESPVRAVPTQLEVVSDRAEARGVYSLVQGVAWQGLPVWDQDGSLGQRIYSDAEGRWLVGTAAVMASSAGWLLSEDHFGRMPHEISTWEAYTPGGWVLSHGSAVRQIGQQTPWRAERGASGPQSVCSQPGCGQPGGWICNSCGRGFCISDKFGHDGCDGGADTCTPSKAHRSETIRTMSPTGLDEESDEEPVTAPRSFAAPPRNQLEQQLSAAERGRFEAEVTARHLEGQCDTLRAELSDAQSEAAELRACLRTADAEIAALRGANEELRRRVDTSVPRPARREHVEDLETVRRRAALAEDEAAALSARLVQAEASARREQLRREEMLEELTRVRSLSRGFACCDAGVQTDAPPSERTAVGDAYQPPSRGESPYSSPDPKAELEHRLRRVAFVEASNAELKRQLSEARRQQVGGLMAASEPSESPVFSLADAPTPQVPTRSPLRRWPSDQDYRSRPDFVPPPPPVPQGDSDAVFEPAPLLPVDGTPRGGQYVSPRRRPAAPPVAIYKEVATSPDAPYTADGATQVGAATNVAGVQAVVGSVSVEVEARVHVRAVGCSTDPEILEELSGMRELRDRLSEREKQICAVEGKAITAQAQEQSTRLELQAVEAQLVALRAAQEAARQVTRPASVQTEESGATIDELRDNADKAAAACAALKEELESLRAAADKHEQDAKAARAEAADSQQRVTALEAELKAAREQENKLNSEIAELRQTLEAVATADEGDADVIIFVGQDLESRKAVEEVARALECSAEGAVVVSERPASSAEQQRAEGVQRRLRLKFTAEEEEAARLTATLVDKPPESVLSARVDRSRELRDALRGLAKVREECSRSDELLQQSSALLAKVGDLQKELDAARGAAAAAEERTTESEKREEGASRAFTEQYAELEKRMENTEQKCSTLSVRCNQLEEELSIEVEEVARRRKEVRELEHELARNRHSIPTTPFLVDDMLSAASPPGGGCCVVLSAPCDTEDPGAPEALSATVAALADVPPDKVEVIPGSVPTGRILLRVASPLPLPTAASLVQLAPQAGWETGSKPTIPGLEGDCLRLRALLADAEARAAAAAAADARADRADLAASSAAQRDEVLSRMTSSPGGFSPRTGLSPVRRRAEVGIQTDLSRFDVSGVEDLVCLLTAAADADWRAARAALPNGPAGVGCAAARTAGGALLERLAKRWRDLQSAAAAWSEACGDQRRITRAVVEAAASAFSSVAADPYNAEAKLPLHDAPELEPLAVPLRAVHEALLFSAQRCLSPPANHKLSVSALLRALAEGPVEAARSVVRELLPDAEPAVWIALDAVERRVIKPPRARCVAVLRRLQTVHVLSRCWARLQLARSRGAAARLFQCCAQPDQRLDRALAAAVGDTNYRQLRPLLPRVARRASATPSTPPLHPGRAVLPVVHQTMQSQRTTPAGVRDSARSGAGTPLTDEVRRILDETLRPGLAPPPSLAGSEYSSMRPTTPTLRHVHGDIARREETSDGGTSPPPGPSRMSSAHVDIVISSPWSPVP
eukprot:Hpha_TRINITY_DN15743_c1_g4::TRINITY_DN15743_c1_g4_i1::g.40041::m.40041